MSPTPSHPVVDNTLTALPKMQAWAALEARAGNAEQARRLYAAGGRRTPTQLPAAVRVGCRTSARAAIRPRRPRCAAVRLAADARYAPALQANTLVCWPIHPCMQGPCRRRLCEAVWAQLKPSSYYTPEGWAELCSAVPSGLRL